jgi:hypothetical protein
VSNALLEFEPSLSEFNPSLPPFQISTAAATEHELVPAQTLLFILTSAPVSALTLIASTEADELAAASHVSVRLARAETPPCTMGWSSSAGAPVQDQVHSAAAVLRWFKRRVVCEGGAGGTCI